MPHYPFGQPVIPVVQQDRSPKRVFILGVYASAVHARWVAPTGRTLIHALAVASEPSIFWRGEHAADLIARIPVPPEVGRLADADTGEPRFNGPSGRALDAYFLQPLGLTRSDVWLCDLLPESRCNPGQRQAIEREYQPWVRRGVLPPTDVPPVPAQLVPPQRRDALVHELEEARAEVLVLLGDLPIQHFLAIWQPGARALADFGATLATYGRRHRVRIGRRELEVLPLVHPRQAAGLGAHAAHWRVLHAEWCRDVAASVLTEC